MTRFLVLSPVFPPEPVVSAKTSAQIAEALALRGHRVEVITAFPNRPAGRPYPGYGPRLYRRESTPGGVAVRRCFSTVSAESKMISRFAENISFGLTSGLAFLLGPRPDVIYANTWPVFASGIMACLARLRKVPFVISVQDIYPESLVVQGRVGSQDWIARVLRFVDGHIARRAAAVVVISETFADIYRNDRRVSPSRLHVIPNWLEARTAVSPDAGTAIRDELGLPSDAFLLVYGGNVGAAAGVEGVIESLRLLPPHQRPYLLIAGAGPQLRACQALASQIDPIHIRFYSPWPEDKTLPVYAAADLLILPTRGKQSLASVPSKAIAYMLAARPILAQALPESDLASVIDRAGCGWIVQPDQPGALAEQILHVMALSPEERAARGRAGREYALRRLTRDVCLPRVLDLLESVAAQNASRRSAIGRTNGF